MKFGRHLFAIVWFYNTLTWPQYTIVANIVLVSVDSNIVISDIFTVPNNSEGQKSYLINICILQTLCNTEGINWHISNLT